MVLLIFSGGLQKAHGFWADVPLSRRGQAPIHEFLEAERFPFVRGTKRGFSADRNLVGDVDEDQDGLVAKSGGLMPRPVKPM